MSRSTPKSFVLPVEAARLPEPVVALADLSDRLDLAAVFGRPGSVEVEVEVGFGKGRLLLERAAAAPERLFLGIERAAPYLRLVRHRVLLAGLGNVRLLLADAADAFHRLLPPRSLARVNVLFPDPWPKRRHHPRRLIQPPFLRDVAAALLPDGRLNIVTDHDDYWRWIERAAGQVDELIAALETDLEPDVVLRTHFATKLAAAGAAFHHLTLRPRPAPPS